MSIEQLETLHFVEPQYLWLLVAPGVLLALWVWQLARRERDRRRFRLHRKLPSRERLAVAGGLLSWLCLIGATAATIAAMARPTVTVPVVRAAGIDVVILQDGSASMRTADVRDDRWQRSIRFLRTLGESLRWNDDRIALALFARVAEPQIRLTKDPNTFFFFLDHLEKESPFRLEDDATWDTNIELGVYWGVRLIDRDQQLRGKSPNAKVFVLISDGQAWSGDLADAIQLARDRHIPIFAVGVGTTTGGMIPEAPKMVNGVLVASDSAPVHAVLDRQSLTTIATAGGGQYLELDRESDQEISNRIIDSTRRRAGSAGIESTVKDLYWQFLLAAAGLIALGVVFVQERAELWLSAIGAGAALIAVWTLTR